MVISIEFAAAAAAYNTRRKGVKLTPQSLEQQDPEGQRRWVKIAAAAAAYPLMHKVHTSTGSAPRAATPIREPLPNTSTTESTRTA